MCTRQDQSLIVETAVGRGHVQSVLIVYGVGLYDADRLHILGNETEHLFASWAKNSSRAPGQTWFENLNVHQARAGHDKLAELQTKRGGTASWSRKVLCFRK